MSRIFLLLESHQNRQLLARWLAAHHEIVLVQQIHELAHSFDLCLVDGPALDQYWLEIEQRKQTELPAWLPILLVTSRQDAGLATRHLWKRIDEILTTPIEKVELHARIEVLLRARDASLLLYQRNQDLSTSINAMAHDLRSPLHVIMSTIQLFAEEQFANLNQQGRRDIERILACSRQMEQFISALLHYGRLGRQAVEQHPVALSTLMESCLLDLQDLILARGATISVTSKLPVVLGDLQLLKIILLNLLSNALSYVSPGVSPVVTVSTRPVDYGVRIQIQDNGIGIAPEQQAQVFLPFIRLRMVNQPGHGLGLAIAHKAVELLGGRIGLESTPGTGSLFWVELAHADQE